MRLSENMRVSLKRVARNGPEQGAATDQTFLALERRRFVFGEVIPGKPHLRRWTATYSGKAAVSRGSAT